MDPWMGASGSGLLEGRSPDEGRGHVNNGTKQRWSDVHGGMAPIGPIVRRWYTVPEVAEMLGYGPTKVRMMCITGDLRSLKDGGSRRILPAWVDEYVAMRAAEAEADWP